MLHGTISVARVIDMGLSSARPQSCEIILIYAAVEKELLHDTLLWLLPLNVPHTSVFLELQTVPFPSTEKEHNPEG